MSRVVDSPSPESTEGIGESIAAQLQGGDILLLEGDLAAGKTTMVRGVVRALGGDDSEVSSPSFVLVQSYPCAGATIDVVHHVDLYRLRDTISDLREIGVEELLSDPAAVTAVEWPKDALAVWMPANARLWRVVITTGDDDLRRIEIHSPDPERRHARRGA
jgi:tRNA threonylcarbamoyl adenosine modification protein YjeE